jgi:2-polyprenyl-3-methyl-5-hydroxy-6-metoxy-1,4-benzoquinol methylase
MIRLMTYRLDPEQAETRVLHELADFAGRDVLEVGCGDGRLTWRYTERAASVLALDPKETEIERARAATPVHLRGRVAFRVADITSEAPAIEAFDIALLSWSIC